MSVNKFGLDFDLLKNASKFDAIPEVPSTNTTPEEPPKRKRGRPKKSEQQQSSDNNNTTIVTRNTTSVNSGLPLCQTNEPYEDTYNETNNMLRISVAQLDILANDVKTEIDDECRKFEEKEESALERAKYLEILDKLENRYMKMSSSR
jgi:hypothetical protein